MRLAHTCLCAVTITNVFKTSVKRSQACLPPDMYSTWHNYRRCEISCDALQVAWHWLHDLWCVFGILAGPRCFGQVVPTETLARCGSKDDQKTMITNQHPARWILEFTSDQHCFNDVVVFAFAAMNMGSERLAKMLGMSVQQMEEDVRAFWSRLVVTDAMEMRRVGDTWSRIQATARATLFSASSKKGGWRWRLERSRRAAGLGVVPKPLEVADAGRRPFVVWAGYRCNNVDL